MKSPDSELLVDVAPQPHNANEFSLFGEMTNSSNLAFSINTLKETLVHDNKKVSTPEHEGNINCAMDLFAPDQSSVSSTNSRISNSSTVGLQHLSTSSEPKDTSDSDKVGHFKAKIGNNYLTLLNEHDQDAVSVTSDSSLGDGFNFMHRTMSSPKNSPSASSRPPAPPRLSRAASPHFPSSSITFPSNQSKTPSSSNKQWTFFSDDKENKLPGTEKPKIFPMRAPPAIPDRKSMKQRNKYGCVSPAKISDSPMPTPSPVADLLTMAMDDFEQHLSDTASSPVPPLVVVKPAIPPRRSLFSTSSAVSGSGSQADDSDLDLLSLPQPNQNGHVNPAHLSSGSCSPAEQLQTPSTTSTSIFCPPIPPRKDLNIQKPDLPDHKFVSEQIEDVAFFSAANECGSTAFSFDVSSSTPSWVNFDDISPQTTILNNNVASADLLSNAGDILDPVDDNLIIPGTGHIDPGLNEMEALNKEDEESLWKKPSSSPDVRSSASKKKGAKGIGYLCLENDDCDNFGSSDTLDEKKTCLTTVRISLPENDLSPEKPQSQWSTFQNEDEEDAEADNVSCVNSSPSFGIDSSGLAGSLNDVDGGSEDDFGMGINRLSTEIPDLKGFNRADKGSQNNLVDFSDDRGSAAASIGSRENPDDDDVETVFDLTAQGDSLKRKRPKGALSMPIDEDKPDSKYDTEIQNEKIVFHVGPAGVDDSVFDEEINLFELSKPDVQIPTPVSTHSSRSATPANTKVDSVGPQNCDKFSSSTNPFWSPTSTSGPSSTSQCSLVDSPFDNIVFKANMSPLSDEGTTSSNPSTPVRINLTASPVTPGQLFRIPPPPLSLSRSSTRTRHSSQPKIRSHSHGSHSAKKLDLDSVSDSSVSVTAFPVSKAETPVLVTTDNDTSDGGELLSAVPIASADNIFDPFSIYSKTDINNSVTLLADARDEDLFNWVDTSIENKESKLLNSENVFLPMEIEDNAVSEETQDITLVLDNLDSSFSTQNNTNTNAHIHTDAKDEIVLQELFSMEIQTKTEVVEETFPVSSFSSDPLLELKKATSVESPIEFQVMKRSILPEVELVESKTSWDVYMRFPPTKRAMSNRKWVPIHVKLSCEQIDNPLVRLYYTSKAQEAFRTVSLANHQMQVSKPKLQAHYSDEGQVLGKLQTVKVMVVNYKEKQTFSPRRSLTRNASGFKHACRGKQSIKFGFTAHHDVVSFCKATRDVMFTVHKRIPKAKEEEHTATVKYHSRDELLIDVQDELQAIVLESGVMEACKVRVYFFVSSFLSGDPLARITINDRKMEGKEVVRREDIIPTSMEGWIDIRDPELHESCTTDSYEEGGDGEVGTCTFYPPDACRFELMRFATCYAENELPVIVKSSVSVKGARLQLRCILRMSGNHSANKDPLTQIACEDVMIRFPVPDEWGAFFRVDGRFRNHSVKAKRAAKQRRRPSAEAGVTMEASVGVAKYEKAYGSIVWRLPRLPEKGAVQNTPRVFSCRIELGSDRDLERLRTTEDNTETKGDGYRGGLDSKFRWCEVEYSMPGPTASNVCVRSVSLPNTDRAEKFVSYQSNYIYKVGINVTAEPVGTEGEEDIGTKLCSVQ